MSRNENSVKYFQMLTLPCVMSTNSVIWFFWRLSKLLIFFLEF